MAHSQITSPTCEIGSEPWLAQYHDQEFDGDPLKDWSFKKYAAYTSHMDAAVGRLLESLQVMGQRENTLVIFASDNGAINDAPIHSSDKYPGWQEAYPRLGSNAPYRGVKAQLYEGGVRSPTIVHWHGELGRGAIDHPVQVVDWMPTLSRLIGAEPSADPRWDGQDIWPLICGDAPDPAERRLFWNFRDARSLGIRRGDWKLISNLVDDERRNELYNVGSDPLERDEVSAKHPELVTDLWSLIEEERHQDGSSARPEVDSPLVG